MKNSLLTLLTLLLLSAVSAFAVEVTFDFSDPASFGVEKPAKDDRTFLTEFSKDNITVNIDVKEATDNSRICFYNSSSDVTTFRCSKAGGQKNQTFTVIAPENANITKISFAGSSWSFSAATGWDSKNHVWSGNASEVTFTTTSTMTLSSMTVEYESTEPSTDPKISANAEGYTLVEGEAENNVVEKGTVVTFNVTNCEDADILGTIGEEYLTFTNGEATATINEDCKVEILAGDVSALYNFTVFVPKEIEAITSTPEAVDGVITIEEGKTITFTAKNATSIAWSSEIFTTLSTVEGDSFTYTVPYDKTSDVITIEASNSGFTKKAEFNVVITPKPVVLYTVEEVIAKGVNYTEKNVWVVGYIVGVAKDNSNGIFDASSIASSKTSSNVLLASTPDCTDYEKCVPVQLSSDKNENKTTRAALNLIDNPSNLGKEVKIKGNVEKYFTKPGLKAASDYVFIEPTITLPTELYIHHYSMDDWRVEQMTGEASEFTHQIWLEKGESYFFTTHNGETPEVEPASLEATDPTLDFTDHYVFGQGTNKLPGETLENLNYYTAAQQGVHTLSVKVAADGTHTHEVVGDVSTGIEDVTVDNAAVEYFNLQGVRVANPANGIYLRRQGNKVSKIYVR